MKRPRKGQGKLALMRRADTERDRSHSIGGSVREAFTFGEPAPISLPRLKFMEQPLDDDEPKGSR